MLKTAKARRAVRTAEEDKRRRKEQLDREIELSVLNNENNRRLWRELLLRVKMPEMKQQVEIGWQAFERALDWKDYRINVLRQALWEAEEQNLLNAKSHVEIIDRLLMAYEERLRTGVQEFRENLATALKEKRLEIEGISRENNEREMLLRKIVFVVNQRHENLASNARSNAISKVDAFVEDAKNERTLAATRLENRQRDLSNDLRVILSNYRTATESRRRECESMGKKDEKERHLISCHCDRIAALQQEIEKFREKIANYETFKSERLRQIMGEYQFFRNTYQEEKTNFIAEMNRDKKRTAVMSVEYNKTIKRLNKIIKKGARILTLMRICRKYETQDEKIIPFRHEMQLENQGANINMNPCSTSLMSTGNFPYTAMPKFWERVGTIQVIAAELRGERDQLLSVTKALKKRLKETS